jgi:hypothetical protein
VPEVNGISFEALRAQLMKHEGLLQNLSISIDRGLVPPPPEHRGSVYERFVSHIPHVLSVPYVRNNAQFIAFTLLFTLVNLGLIIGRLYEYRIFKNADGSRNWCVMIARASGESVKCVVQQFIKLFRCELILFISDTLKTRFISIIFMFLFSATLPWLNRSHRLIACSW